jgi:hypothetical protein
MGRHVMDVRTADLLLGGVLGPADAPPAYAEVARLFEAVRAPATTEELIREAETITAMAAAIESAPLVVVPDTPAVAPKERLSILRRPKRLALVVLAATLATTLALALARLLPGPAQRFFHHVVPGIPGPASETTLGSRFLRLSETRAPTPLDRSVSANKAATTKPEPSGASHFRGRHVKTVERAKDPGRKWAGHEAQRQRREASNDRTSAVTPGQGLCNAYFRGQGGENGNKYEANAFEQLQSEAGARGESVSEYCTTDDATAREDSSKTGGGNDEKHQEAVNADATSTSGGGRGKRDPGPGGHGARKTRSVRPAPSTRSTHAQHKE